jgi:hypothetical protein
MTLCRALNFDEFQGMRVGTQKRLSAQQRKVYALFIKRGTLADFARDLSDTSGENVSWERVWSWVLRGSVSKKMVPHVHRPTRVPFKDLIS